MTTTQPSTCLATALTNTSSTTWHDRLGHPESQVLSFLRGRDLISCNKEYYFHFYNYCQVGKHLCLLFHQPASTTHSAFDIIHADLWTSFIRSFQGHKYYLVL